jgi:DNA-binding winged helix-turn-helix (wHTH) protein
MDQHSVRVWGYRFVGITLDLYRREVRRADGRECRLQPRMFELLAFLVCNRDRVVSKEEVAQKVWAGSVVCAHAIPQCVCELRKALGDARLIATYSRVGYRFVAPAEPLVEREPRMNLSILYAAQDPVSAA